VAPLAGPGGSAAWSPSSMIPRRALVFTGFMGAGKSTAAAEVARELGGEVLDTDRLLEARLGHSIAREFELHGESSFREHEEVLVCELLAQAGGGARSPTLIALGGGAVLSARVREALAAHVVVLLEIDPSRAWERVRAQAGERPLARDPEAFAALHAERRGLYEGLADAILPADRPGVAVRALPALRMLAAVGDAPDRGTEEGERGSGVEGEGAREDGGGPRGGGRARLLWAAAASGEYPVIVARGLLKLALRPEGWPLDRGASRTFCVTDENVGALYAQRLGELAALIAIPPGESHKTLATAERVWRDLAHGGMTRADHLIALGGGVVGDLAGFCAATYQRGVPVVQVPTTLVAQVDSAYGGKTGVDLPEAKNYIGAYHQPAAVIVDPDTLGTLPAVELNAGWVEVLKTALIAGGELWERVAAERLPVAEEPTTTGAGGRASVQSASVQGVDERTILACARLKLAVVAEDERDGGRRQVLNLGHTVGHAIETATGYSRYRHGEAVGLGLLAALRLSGREELRAQVRELLLAHGLPVTLEGAGLEEVVAAVAHDKKRLSGSTPFVLLDAPGDVRVGCEVPEAQLRAAVAELA
jgi:shikimate kinase/3-dehydroquinate synthase